MRTLSLLVLVVSALLHKEASHDRSGALGIALKKPHNGKASALVAKKSHNDGDDAAADDAKADDAKADDAKADDAKADDAKADDAKADDKKDDAKDKADEAAALRCELILETSLETIHDKGGVEAFANAAESELANAAGVERTCIHIMNLRGKYKHGMAGLNFIQTMLNRDAGSEVIVDFEILPDCGDQAAAFTKVEEALKDEKSSLKTGWLSAFLSGASVVKGGEPSDGAVSGTTMTVGPAPEQSAAVAMAAVLALFLRA